MTATSRTTAPRGQRLPRSTRRAQLLEAAQAVFVEAGYHQAAMDDIAERAGVSKPVLYQHFPGKLDLYLALLDQHSEALEQLVKDAMATTGAGEDHDNKVRVQATVEAYFAFVSQEGAAFRLVFESDLTGEPQVRNRIDQVSLVCGEAIADVIVEDTGVDEDRAMILGVALAGMAQVTARYWLAQGADIPQSEAAGLVSSLAWRGLGSFPRVGEANAAAHG